MCLTSSMPNPAFCNLAGGILRVLVAKSEDLVLTGVGASFTITDTGVTRSQITAIAAGLDWYEIKFDKKRDASAAAENTLGGRPAYTHTVSVLTSTADFDTQRSLTELQNCCGYVVLVKYADGNWAMYGLNYSASDASYDPADMQVKYDFTTGANRADAAAGGTVAFSSENVNFSWLPVSPAAAATAIAAIVAHTP